MTVQKHIEYMCKWCGKKRFVQHRRDALARENVPEKRGTNHTAGS